jgi:hypothetical protein
MGKKNQDNVTIMYGAPFPKTNKPKQKAPKKNRLFRREDVRRLLVLMRDMEANYLQTTLANPKIGLAILDDIAAGKSTDHYTPPKK